jgi:hypothetical protein
MDRATILDFINRGTDSTEQAIVEGAHGAIDNLITEENSKSLINYLISGITGVPGAGGAAMGLMGDGTVSGTVLDLPKYGLGEPGSYPDQGGENVGIFNKDLFVKLMNSPDKDKIIADNPDLQRALRHFMPKWEAIQHLRGDSIEGYKNAEAQLFQENRDRLTAQGDYQSPLGGAIDDALSYLNPGNKASPFYKYFSQRPISGIHKFPKWAGGGIYQGESRATMLEDLLSNRIPGITVRGGE